MIYSIILTISSEMLSGVKRRINARRNPWLSSLDSSPFWAEASFFVFSVSCPFIRFLPESFLFLHYKCIAYYIIQTDVFQCHLKKQNRNNSDPAFLFYSYILCFFCSKKSFVSFTTTPLNANNAIIFGNAINPLKISAIVQTAETVM